MKSAHKTISVIKMIPDAFPGDMTMIINKIKMHEPVTIKNDPDSLLLVWV